MKCPLAFIILTTIALASAQAYDNTPSLPSLTTRTASDCRRGCRFRFCILGAGGDFFPIPNGNALSVVNISTEPLFICRLGGRNIGRVRTVGTALVRRRNSRFVPIDTIGSRSLARQFPSNFFRVKAFDLPARFRVSTIRRSRFRGTDQRNALEGRCVLLPLETWEVVDDDGNIRAVRSASGSDERDCVSFVSTDEPTQIKVQLMWNSTSDLDVMVTEPGGTVIRFNRRRSSNGGCLFDDVLQADCINAGAARDALETIEYSGLSSPEEGTYTVDLDEPAVCDGVSTAWKLTITIRDSIILMNEGTLPPPTSNGRGIFKSVSFTFPSGEMVGDM